MIASDQFSRKYLRRKAKGPSYGLSRELMAIGRKHEVFLNAQAGAGQELPEQQIGENGRNMRRVTVFVHHTESAGKEEFQASCQGIDIRGGNDGNTVLGEKAGDVSQETDGTFDVFDHFHGEH
jgi:hypothetical protein